METKIEKLPDGSSVLVIRVPIAATLTVSSTGKSYLLVNTHGFVKTGAVYNDKPVSLSVNAIIPVK